MYTLKIETKNPKKTFTIKLNQLQDIYEKTNHVKKQKKIAISEMLNKFKMGINILQPTKNNEDFIFLYTNATFWNYFKKDLNKYLIGRQFNEVLPKLSQASYKKTSIKTLFSSKIIIDSIIKLYQDNTLIKVWSQNKSYYKNQLIITIEDNTEFFKEKEQEEKIFHEASFPKIQINKQFKVLKVNKAYIKDIGYTREELNNVSYNNLILEYKQKTKGITNFPEGLQAVFDKKEKSILSQVKIITKKGEQKYFKCYSRLINDDTIQVGFHDFTKLKQTQEKELNISNYFNQMQKMNKIALSLRSGDKVKWSPEIYEIMEILPDTDKGYKDNFIYKHILNGDEIEIQKALNDLTPYNVTRCLFKVKTGNFNIKYLRTVFQITYEKGEKLILGFLQDTTDEILAQKEAIRLQNNFNLIEESNNIGISEYHNGKFSFTTQIYKMLGVHKNEYPNNVDIVRKYLVPDDIEKWRNALKLTPEQDVLDVTYRIQNKTKEIKYIYCKNKAVFNKNGEINRILGFLTDITDITKTKQSAIELQNNLKHIQKNSKIVISTYQNGIYDYTSEIYNILEINAKDYPNNIDLLRYFTLSADKESINIKFKKLSPKNPNQHLIIRIQTPKENIKYLEVYIESKYNKNRRLLKRIYFIHEITSIIEREKELEQLSKDRMLLLQEVHDRVKNNLQLILSFINIDSHNNKNNNPEYILKKTKSRIQTMALTHEEVYQSNNISQIDLKNFITKNLFNFLNLYSQDNIELQVSTEPIKLDMDRSIPLGLLINEVLMNTIKYAFPNNQKGKFYLKIGSVEILYFY